ncbi:cap methyltransferase 1 isoform X4 [Tachypleus tridentatus]|uniref:cap methyltransferase 1 isoform X4 n=1 Tax=Tachypleus tridentatus TaxID=6853 RepID=UPI003FD2F12A
MVHHTSHQGKVIKLAWTYVLYSSSYKSTANIHVAVIKWEMQERRNADELEDNCSEEHGKKMTIDDETHFCDPEVLKNILGLKTVFDQLEPEEMRRARTRSNSFETIRGVIFQNRAAMKMANIDAIFDFMFTNPTDEKGNSLILYNELLYFADICAGPGGFSEYVLWRKGWHTKGFGFTLKGPNDFKLEEFFAGSPETFEPYYGVGGIEGDGDIYVPENLREFRRFVMENTEGKGLHFVMADGGFSVEGQENIQEILSKRLYLCQFLCALSVLRTGGHFVCKLFDIFTPFSVGLVYLMYRAFKKICIHKPNTSRPANSERYLICKWRREDTKDIHDYMFEINCRLGQLSGVTSSLDVIEVVPVDLLKDEHAFFNYIVASNDRLGKWQILNLAKIRAFAQNNELYEERQSDLRKECLKLWKVPDRARSAPSKPDPKSKFFELMKGESSDYMNFKAEELTQEKLKAITSIYDYYCIVLGMETNNQSQTCFILSLGRNHIFWKEPRTLGCRWIKLDLKMDLPANTLLCAELVQELNGEGRAQRRIKAVHILDALCLGGDDVRALSFMERIHHVQKFVKAVSKPSIPNLTPIKAKEIFPLREIDQVFNHLTMKVVKGSGGIPQLCYSMTDGKHFIPSGLLILKTVEYPWIIAYSKTNQRTYFFNTKTRTSVFDGPNEAISSFRSCFISRLFWSWDSGVKLVDGHIAASGKVHRHTITDFVDHALGR